MPNVDITVGKRIFQLVCDEGQEDHLKDLASGITERMDEISKVAQGTSENMLLVMASLMLQDELNSARKRLQKKQKDPRQPDLYSQGEEIDEAVSEAVETIADYVETLADRIKTA